MKFLSEIEEMRHKPVAKDPWNGWVFRSEIGGKMEKEDSREEEEQGNFSSSRNRRLAIGFGLGNARKPAPLNWTMGLPSLTKP